MTSPTAKHDRQNVVKDKARGRRRKNHARNHGTTAANLELNKPNANEVKQAAAKKQRQAAVHGNA